jgi:hypothetical protein
MSSNLDQPEPNSKRENSPQPRSERVFSSGAKGTRTPDPTLPGTGTSPEQAAFLALHRVVDVVEGANVVRVVVKIVVRLSGGGVIALVEFFGNPDLDE